MDDQYYDVLKTIKGAANVLCRRSKSMHVSPHYWGVSYDRGDEKDFYDCVSTLMRCYKSTLLFQRQLVSTASHVNEWRTELLKREPLGCFLMEGAIAFGAFFKEGNDSDCETLQRLIDTWPMLLSGVDPRNSYGSLENTNLMYWNLYEALEKDSAEKWPNTLGILAQHTKDFNVQLNQAILNKQKELKGKFCPVYNKKVPEQADFKVTPMNCWLNRESRLQLCSDSVGDIDNILKSCYNILGSRKLLDSKATDWASTVSGDAKSSLQTYERSVYAQQEVPVEKWREWTFSANEFEEWDKIWTERDMGDDAVGMFIDIVRDVAQTDRTSFIDVEVGVCHAPFAWKVLMQIQVAATQYIDTYMLNMDAAVSEVLRRTRIVLTYYAPRLAISKIVDEFCAAGQDKDKNAGIQMIRHIHNSYAVLFRPVVLEEFINLTGIKFSYIDPWKMNSLLAEVVPPICHEIDTCYYQAFMERARLVYETLKRTLETLNVPEAVRDINALLAQDHLVRCNDATLWKTFLIDNYPMSPEQLNAYVDDRILKYSECKAYIF